MKVGMISLGCDKNRVDSETMLYLLKSAGYKLCPNADDADIMIVNTCAFIDKAKVETIDTVLEVAALKKKNLRYLIVTGCFSQRYGSDVTFPEVDAFVNVADEVNIVSILDKITGRAETSHAVGCDLTRVLTTPQHYAYLKIADGCDNRCSYCAIPSIRGRYISRPMESIVKESAALCLDGVKELILVAQDVTNYGKDLYGKPSLVPLLTALCQLDFWKIRILYAYPERIDDTLLQLIAHNDKIAKYIDIPFQHVDTALLKKMNRRTTGDAIHALMDKIRSLDADIAVRSTFICGFPYEEETEHGILTEFLKNGADYAGFFAYSPEEGTPAFAWKNRANKRTVGRWVKECEVAQTQFTIQRHQRFVGRVMDVLYEGIDYKQQCFYGRNEFNAPDADTLVYFTADFPLHVGKVYSVQIDRADFHLYGKAVLQEGSN